LYYFVTLDRKSGSASRDKGLLFERLVLTLLRSTGFTEDIRMRAKESGLEYDIEARHAVQGHCLAGEAKALSRKVSDEILTFYGKMTYHWMGSKQTLGLFISTTDLTADMQNHMRAIQGQNNFQWICGSAVLDVLHKTARYMLLDEVKELASSHFPGTRAGDTALLVTDRGDYFAQLLIGRDKTRAASFCIIHCQGSLVEDEGFARLVSAEVDILKGLSYVCSNSRTAGPVLEEPSGFMGVLPGSDWFDYQLPADPERFVGREAIIEDCLQKLDDIQRGSPAARVFEIKSRSGVGKSSLCLKLQARVRATGGVAIVIDARNLRNTLDLTTMCQVLAEDVAKGTGWAIPLPNSLREHSLMLPSIASRLEETQKLLVVFIDQLESTFARPELFDALVDFILECLYVSKRHVFVVARKDDLTTTHDEAQRIDIWRLSSMAIPVPLRDFTPAEAAALVDRIPHAIQRRLRQDLRKYILGFAEGFPWLLKKTCAHVIELIRRGVPQHDIHRDGLRLEELFEDELLSLDEVIRDFLKRLVVHLPAPENELVEAFGPTENVAAKLRTLQSEHRLIRLSGRTFDTYNDVFKEYVKTGKVPHLRRYPFHFTAGPCIRLFSGICQHSWRTVDDAVVQLKLAKGVVYNYLRELTQLDLVKLSDGVLTVEEGARKAFEEDAFGDFLKARVKQNPLVRDVLNNLAAVRRMTKNELARYLKGALPYTDAAEQTWEYYADVLAHWLKSTELAAYRGGTLSLEAAQAEELGERLSLPGVYMQQVERLVNHLKEQGEAPRVELERAMQRTNLTNVLLSGRSLGLIERTRDPVRLSPNGHAFARGTRETRSAYVRDAIQASDTLTGLLRVIEGTEATTTSELVRQGFTRLGMRWTNPATHEWRVKLVANWLEYAGVLQRRSGKRKGLVVVTDLAARPV
jgi:hypothetical protein